MTGLIDTETRAHIRTALTKRAKLKSAEALRRACEHIDLATKCRASMPDDAAPEDHAETLLELHAHIKSADAYLEHAHAPVSVGDDSAEDGEGGPDTLDDPEQRQIRETTRATAAAVLIAGGNAAEAKKLVRKPTTRSPR